MAFSSPIDILSRFGLHEGHVVADLGAGSGFYTLAAAKLVGEGGKVYAIEIQKEVLARLVQHARQEHLKHLIFIHGDAEKPQGSTIADSMVDAVLLCNVLFQTEQKATLLAEAKRILKPGGRVLVVDWAGSFGGTGPQPQYVVISDMARELFKRAGFAEVGPIPAGDHHWGFIFRK